MHLRNDFIAVKIPATSTNLDPGFDSIGLALGLQGRISVRATTGTASVIVRGEGAGNVKQGEGNLVVYALHLVLDRVGIPRAGACIHYTSHTPHSRGLGSSANAVVADVMLARALTGDADVLGCREILATGSQMERHPGNVAPAISGGATVPWMDDKTSEVGSVHLTPPEGISPVALIPDSRLHTATTRAVLPATAPHSDASSSAVRDTLLAVVLPGNTQVGGKADLYALLMEAMRDHLYQEQRRTTMEPSLALVDWLRGADSAAVVSGAGPTVLSLESVGADIRQDTAAAGWRVVSTGAAPQDAQITCGGPSKVEF